MKALINAALGVSMGFSGLAFAGSHMMVAGTLFCNSAANYEKKLEEEVRGVNVRNQNCGVTQKPMVVELVQTSLMGPTEVFVPASNVTIFVDRNSLK